MCVYSMIADNTIDDWQRRVPAHPDPVYPLPYVPPVTTGYVWVQPIINPLTQLEIDALRKLLEAAKVYDKETGQPDCELEAKKTLLRELAKKLGFDNLEL